MGIPTVPRRNEADYLTRTLETLLQELPSDSTDPLYAKVRVLVMNNRPGNHSVFYAVSLRHLSTALSVCISGQRHTACLPSAHRTSPHMRHPPRWATEELVKVLRSHSLAVWLKGRTKHVSEAKPLWRCLQPVCVLSGSPGSPSKYAEP